MPTWLEVVVGIGAGLAVLWSATIVVLLVAGRHSDQTTLREALRLLPDIIRLIRRLIADTTLPRRIRILLGLLLVYLLSPIDLVPDFIPVIGYADDAIIVAIALRATVRAAGAEAVGRHWPGTPTGLATLRRLARLPGPGEDPPPDRSAA